MITKSSATELGSLTPKVIIQLDTPSGNMQVLEYTLQDFSFLHVVQWHFNHILGENGLPVFYDATFFRDKKGALSHAEEVGNELLKCI